MAYRAECGSICWFLSSSFFFAVLVFAFQLKGLYLIGKIEAEIGLSSSAFLRYQHK